jgi:large subunit ribosomal protein L11
VAEKKTIDLLVNGGQATAGPPLGPTLGPLGVNVLAVVNRINELTKAYSGMKIPVKIEVDTGTKAFEVVVGTPTTAALIVRELGVEKATGDVKKQVTGNLTMAQVLKLAEAKRQQLLASDLKASVREVLGCCLSVGVTVEGKSPKEVQKEISKGVYDQLFQGKA